MNYFTTDPEWAEFASKNGFPLPSGDTPTQSLQAIEPLEIDIAAARADQVISDTEWESEYPLETRGYTAKFITIKSRDGADISVKVSHPNPSRLLENGNDASLPVLFVAHGGGWVQGTHISEERWLLWPLYEHFDLVIVSVDYRLTPEHQHPVWIQDCWDVLKDMFSLVGSSFSGLDVKMDLQRVILAGSSSGGGISAVLSQMCRDEQLPIFGVILNVPVLCDYRHFPAEYRVLGDIGSYEQCVDTFSSGAMIWLWNLIHPSATSGIDPQVSPLLGNCKALPRHLVFVAGQDALRDEGIAYAAKLKDCGVSVELNIFPGVPHHFSQFWELKSTSRFWERLRSTLRQWFN